MKDKEVLSKCQLSENILFHCTKTNFMQKPGPRRGSSSPNSGPGVAVEWRLELNDALAMVPQLSKCLKFEAVWGVLTDQVI